MKKSCKGKTTKGKTKKSIKGIQQKGKTYYIVKQVDKKRKWIPVGPNLETAIRERNKLDTLVVTRQITEVKKILHISENEISYIDAVNQYDQEHLVNQKSRKCLYGYFKKSMEFFKDKNLNEITMQDILDYRTERLKTVLKPTVQQEIDMISALYNYQANKLKWKGIILLNPCEQITDLEFNNTRQGILSHEDFLKILSAKWTSEYKRKVNGNGSCEYGIKPHLQLALLIADYTGQRIYEEICQMKWSDIQQGRYGKEIKVRGKGDKDRIVPLHDELVKILECQERDSEYIISYKGKPIADNGLKKHFGKVLEKTGFKGLHIHDFRRRFTTRLKRNGVDTEDIKKVTGHSTDSAFRRYVDLGNDLPPVFYGKSENEEWKKQNLIPYVTYEEYQKIRVRTEMCRKSVERRKAA